MVLTFRNVHNWRMGYQQGGQDYSPEAFKQMYAMLKKGGTLGIEDHRLPESASDERETKSGYIKVSTVRRLAEAAGFKFVGASEVNANKADTANGGSKCKRVMARMSPCRPAANNCELYSPAAGRRGTRKNVS